MKTIQQISLLSTGIGSLPHKDASEAVKFLAKTCAHIFVWPQLPCVSRSEDMFIQYSKGFPGLIYDSEEDRYFVDTNSDEYFEALEEFLMDYESIIECEEFSLLDKYALTPEYSCAFAPWLNVAKDLNPPFIKGQVTGPFTYATTLTDQDKKCVYYDETLKEIVEKFLGLKALWQIKEFEKVCPESTYIISLDEPTISQYGSSAFLTVQKKDIINSLNAVAEIIHRYGAVSFTHCCGNTDWSIITSSNVRMLNFDAYNFADSILLYPEDIKQYLNNNCYIAWGLIPTLDPKQVEEANLEKVVDIFEKTVQQLVEKGLNKDKILKQSIITPSCGTGSISVELAEKAIKLSRDVADFLRSKYI
ncbi:MAG: hypothetical protein AB1782_03295 [Cyanobacteriota bacterium]